MELELHPRNVVFATLALLITGFCVGYGLSAIIGGRIELLPVMALLVGLGGVSALLKNGAAEAYGRRTKYWKD